MCVQYVTSLTIKLWLCSNKYWHIKNENNSCCCHQNHSKSKYKFQMVKNVYTKHVLLTKPTFTKHGKNSVVYIGLWLGVR